MLASSHYRNVSKQTTRPRLTSTKEMSVENVSSGLVPQGQKASDYGKPMTPPLLEEYYNPTHGQAEENNNNQAPNASFQEDEFINPFCTRVQEIGESSSRNIDNTDVHSFQPQSHDYRLYDQEDHYIRTSFCGNPPCQFQQDGQLAADLNVYVTLTMIDCNSQQSTTCAKGYAQEEGIDFEESFAPVARLEAEGGVRCLAGWVRLIQIIRKKFYTSKDKALYGLKQDPSVWYDELSNFP
ncbi:hypothetical protein Tco_0064205 [Tanacetum coccineum]